MTILVTSTINMIYLLKKSVAIRQQVIAWANVGPDLCHHVASLGHGDLTCQLEFCRTNISR